MTRAAWAAGVAAVRRVLADATRPGADLGALDRAWARLWPGATPAQQAVLAQLGEDIQACNDRLAHREGRA